MFGRFGGRAKHPAVRVTHSMHAKSLCVSLRAVLGTFKKGCLFSLATMLGSGMQSLTTSRPRTISGHVQAGILIGSG